PDGQHFVYVALRSDKHHDIYSGSLDGKPGKLLVHNAGGPTFSAGHLFFEREGYLYAHAFDPANMRLSGDPQPILHQQLAFYGVGGVADYSVAGDLLVYHEQAVSPTQFSWLDLNGNRLQDLVDPAWWDNMSISRDGTKVLTSKNDLLTHTGDVWIIDT